MDTQNPELQLIELAKQSESAKFVIEILEYYVPLVLKLPELRTNPEFMKETVKSKPSNGISDIATQADVYIQEKIKKEVLEKHSDWQFWGEEGTDNITEYDHNKTHLFIIDSIEGTINFKHHKDNHWGSVIGLVDIKTKKPIAGIVALVLKRKFYVGIVGIGAFEFIYDENGKLIKLEQMKKEPEFSEFTYNNSPQFTDSSFTHVGNFLNLCEIQPISKNADKLDSSRKKVSIKIDENKYSFLDLESGALEVVRYRGTIYFQTTNEMAAVFPIIEELGGKVTDGLGRPWTLGIDTLIATRNENDYELLKKIFDSVTKD